MRLPPKLIAGCTLLVAATVFASTPGDPDFSTNKGQLPILDDQGRQLILQGVGDGTSKHTYMRRGQDVDSTIEFQAKALGYNANRFLIFWDHIMPTKGVINTEYLDDVERRLDWFTDHNQHVILDMHQDNWSEVCDGNGAPAWATIGTAETAPGAPWYIMAASPCVVDSVNAFYSNHDGWMDEFVKSWGAVAERFKDHPAVIGYDLMNEPTQMTAIVDQMVHEMLGDTEKTVLNAAVMTTIWSDGKPHNAFESIIRDQVVNLAAGEGIAVPDSYIDKIVYTLIARAYGDWGNLNAVDNFEGKDLTGMYQRVIDRIRQDDQDSYIFVEPMSVSANQGFKTRLGYLNDPGTNGRRLGYIPHMYPRSLHDGGSYSDADYNQVEHWERASRQFVYENNLAFVIGEFGHNNDAANGVQYLKDAVRMMERNKIGFTYWDSNTAWGPYNADTMELLNNAEALINIYPRAVAGTIEDYTYDRDQKTFVLSYTKREGAMGTTDISIPPSVFDNGFVVESSDPDNTWSYSFDADYGVLSINHNASIDSHVITVKPTVSTEVLEYRELLDLRSGRCLNFSGLNPAAGKNINIWECAGKVRQRWVYDETNQYIRNFKNPDFCLTHFGPAEAKDGGNIEIAACADSDDLRWILDKRHNGNIFRNIYNQTYVMSAFGAGTGANVAQWHYEKTALHQRWNWGWKEATESMTSVVSAMKSGKAYDMKIWAKANECALEWDGDLDSDYERNAKFDCKTYGDSMTFNAYSDPVVNANGSVSVTGSIYSYNRACGLEWDANQSYGERNAKFDCSGSSDPVTITTASLGQAVVIASAGCGLEWGGDIMDWDSLEREAKWDCTPKYDGMKLHQVEPVVRDSIVTGKAWAELPGMRQVSIAEDGSMWATSGSFSIHRWNGSSWDTIPGGLKHVSVGSAGEVWGVNISNMVYRYNGNGWTRMPGALTNVSVGNDGSVWGVNANDNIYRWNGSGWTMVTGKLKQVSVGSVGQVWGVNSSNAAYRWNGSGWTKMSNWIANVAVAADGTVWAVSPENKVYTYTDADGWVAVDGYLSQISTGSANQVVGAVNSGGYKSYRRAFN